MLPLTELPALEPLTASNAHRFEHIGYLNFGECWSLAQSPDEKIIATATPRGIWLFDAGDLKKMPVSLSSVRQRVSTLDFSPDSQLLAEAGEDGAVRLWDVARRQVVHELRANGAKLLSARFSPDHQWLCTGDDTGAVRLWHPANGIQSHLFAHPATGPDHQTPEIRSLLFSRDSHFLVTGRGYRDHHIFVWNLSDLQLKFQFETVTKNVRSMIILEDGSTLAVDELWHGYRLFRFLDLNTGKEIDFVEVESWYFEPHGSREGVWTAAGHGGEGNYRLTNKQTGQAVQSWFSGLIEVTADGKWTQGIDSRDKLTRFNIETGAVFDSSDFIFSSATSFAGFSASGRLFIADADNHEVAIWNATTFQYEKSMEIVFEAHGRNFYEQMLYRDNELIGVGNDDEDLPVLWNYDRQINIAASVLPARIIQKDVKILGVNHDWTRLVTDTKNQVELWNLQTGSAETLWHSDTEEVQRKAVFSPNNQYVTFITQDRKDPGIWQKVYVYDVLSLQPVLTFHPAYKTGFSLDSSALLVSATGTGERPVTAIDLATKTVISRLSAISVYADYLSFNAAGDVDVIPDTYEIKVWQWREGKLLKSIPLPEDNTLMEAKISPDGKFFIALQHPSCEISVWGVPESVAPPDSYTESRKNVAND